MAFPWVFAHMNSPWKTHGIVMDNSPCNFHGESMDLLYELLMEIPWYTSISYPWKSHEVLTNDGTYNFHG